MPACTKPQSTCEMPSPVQMTARELFRMFGISERLYEDFLKPILLVGVFAPPEDVSAAEMLGERNSTARGPRSPSNPPWANTECTRRRPTTRALSQASNSAARLRRGLFRLDKPSSRYPQARSSTMPWPTRTTLMSAGARRARHPSWLDSHSSPRNVVPLPFVQGSIAEKILQPLVQRQAPACLPALPSIDEPLFPVPRHRIESRGGRVMGSHIMTDLIVESGRASGVKCKRLTDGAEVLLEADAVIFAVGAYAPSSLLAEEAFLIPSSPCCQESAGCRRLSRAPEPSPPAPSSGTS